MMIVPARNQASGARGKHAVLAVIPTSRAPLHPFKPRTQPPISFDHFYVRFDVIYLVKTDRKAFRVVRSDRKWLATPGSSCCYLRMEVAGYGEVLLDRVLVAVIPG
jgi:hypothetical protein